MLLAATRGTVRALNERARSERLQTTPPAPEREVRLSDGTAASAGDVIITSRQPPPARRLGYRLGQERRPLDHHPASTPTAHSTRHPRRRNAGRTLPADYVSAHVVLGYASTIHGAQGATADTSHTVLTGQETRQQLYVALTRGRHANHLHLALPTSGEDHSAISRDSLIPPSATDLLTRILATDGAQQSATSQLRGLASTEQQLRDAVTRYQDALPAAGDPFPAS